MIPDFSEFLSTIDAEEFTKGMQDAVPPHLVQFQSDDVKSIDTAVQMAIAHAVKASFASSRLLLQQYHEWLQQHL